MPQHAIDGAEGGLAASVLLLGFSAGQKVPDPKLKLPECKTVLGRVKAVDLAEIKKECGQMRWGLFVSGWSSAKK